VGHQGIDKDPQYQRGIDLNTKLSLYGVDDPDGGLAALFQCLETIFVDVQQQIRCMHTPLSLSY